MEQLPADARAAPSASAPNDTVMDIASSPKRPRDPAQDNRVSQRATPFNRQKSQLGSSRFYWEDGNVCVAVGRRNPPRL
eukprot:scaffold7997_cov126-Isochrysis_galbana.AAC.8